MWTGDLPKGSLSRPFQVLFRLLLLRAFLAADRCFVDMYWIPLSMTGLFIVGDHFAATGLEQIKGVSYLPSGGSVQSLGILFSTETVLVLYPTTQLSNGMAHMASFSRGAQSKRQLAVSMSRPRTPTSIKSMSHLLSLSSISRCR